MFFFLYVGEQKAIAKGLLIHSHLIGSGDVDYGPSDREECKSQNDNGCKSNSSLKEATEFNKNEDIDCNIAESKNDDLSHNDKESMIDLLTSLKLEKYVPLFVEEDIGMRALELLTEDDLKSLGVKLGGRRILLDWIQKAKERERERERNSRMKAQRSERLMKKDSNSPRKRKGRSLELVGEKFKPSSSIKLLYSSGKTMLQNNFDSTDSETGMFLFLVYLKEISSNILFQQVMKKKFLRICTILRKRVTMQMMKQPMSQSKRMMLLLMNK